MAGPDDPIQEKPPAGVTYKPITKKQVDELVQQTANGRTLTMNDLQGWGPQATRTFSQAYFAKVMNDYASGANLVMNIAEGRVPPNKIAEEAQKRIGSGRVRDTIINAGLNRGTSIEDRARTIAAIAKDLDVMGSNVSDISQRHTAEANAPPILTQVAAKAFPAAPASGAPYVDKSNGNFQYASVTPAEADRAARDLLAGKYDQVTATTKTWGGNSLGAMLDAYRNRLWPEDLNKAQQALAASGTPEYAERLKTIQSPELKALVEKESAALLGGKSRAEVNYEFDAVQKGIFGKGVEVQTKLMTEFQAREGKFYQERQQQQQNGVSGATTAPNQPARPAAQGSDIDKAAVTLAREKPALWPDLRGWSGADLDTLRASYQARMQGDVGQAAQIAQGLHDGGDPQKIKEIQNPALRKIVDDDMKAGKDMDEIKTDLQTELGARSHFVDQRIEMSYSTPGPQVSQQKLAN